jgi:hypothetical protein
MTDDLQQLWMVLKKIHYYIRTIDDELRFKKKGGILAVNTENLDFSLQIKCW